MENKIRIKETSQYKKSPSEDTRSIYVIDEFGEETLLKFRVREYNNLMDLILNELWEEWGDCRGRAMCGTCQVEVLEGEIGSGMDNFEANTLSTLPNNTSRSRLACQITIDKSVHNLRFRILKDF